MNTFNVILFSLMIFVGGFIFNTGLINLLFDKNKKKMMRAFTEKNLDEIKKNDPEQYKKIKRVGVWVSIVLCVVGAIVAAGGIVAIFILLK